MKNLGVFLLICLLSSLSCSTSKKNKELKIKTYKKHGYSFNYFNSWSNRDFVYDHIFTKKSLTKLGVNPEANNFIMKEKVLNNRLKSIKDVALNDVETIKGHSTNVIYTLKKNTNNNNGNEKYILEAQYEFNGLKYQRLSHYRVRKNTVYILSCTFEKDIYNTCINDVMLAFNSFKFIDQD